MGFEPDGDVLLAGFVCAAEDAFGSRAVPDRRDAMPTGLLLQFVQFALCLFDGRGQVHTLVAQDTQGVDGRL